MPWFVCDTDALATGIWHERYVGTRLPSVEQLAASRPPALYVLTSDDIPFVQDGLRDGEQLRGWMTQRFCEVFTAHSAPRIVVRGSPEDRLAQLSVALGLR